MNSNYSGRLAGWDIHGFHTMEDLDMPSIMQEAGSRWLRPNEIHAILSNYTYFTIHVKPVNLPKGGTLVLFDRKKLRNFRKDGHNWKKKKDGKTVKEAHERLKVGTEERIHVYYAHGEDNTTFVRRCYWLLDKDLEHIVLVHYRETQELQGSPATPVNSDFGSDYKVKPAIKGSIEAGDGSNLTDHEMRLHEINTLEWDDLLESNSPEEAYLSESTQYILQYDQHPVFTLGNNGSSFITNNLPAEEFNFGNTMDLLAGNISAQTDHPSDSFQPTVEGQMYMKKNAADYDMGALGPGDVDDIVQRQDSLARWINHIVADSPESVDEPFYEASVASNGSLISSGAIGEGSTLKQIFSITDISPQWASSSEQTKILVAGFFHQEYQHLGNSKIFCICGDTCVPAEVIQVGVLRCWVPPHPPGRLNFYLSLDQCTPISEVLTLEFHSFSPSKSDVQEVNSQWDTFRIKMRLASLLFSTSKSLDILSSKVSPNALIEGKKFAVKYSKIADSWAYFASLVENGKISFERAKDSLFELAMKSRLKEWLLERIVDESKISERDAHGQGVLHLCAIIGYTWAIYQYSCSGLSLDFRDKFGWTALHWAAYYGREKMVATLLSAGAKPNLVTDPTPENPGGCTAADLASKQAFEGIAAYLSEKALVQQFEDMKIAGNASGSLDTPSNDETLNAPNISEEEICLKDTLTAYRTAADAAARIQLAFRAHSLKQRTNFVESNNPEDEARCIVAAMKIQHAYRNYDVRKKMAAAARIQYRFRTWKMRREFLNMRRHAIKIQAAYRGYRERRQYKKICWSVGVLEKALFRWRLKRKGLRGLRLPAQQEPVSDEKQESDVEEDFYRASRKQAEERVDKAVRRIQGMFRSLQAQQDYHRMKLTHRQAELEYEECTNNHDHLRQV